MRLQGFHRIETLIYRDGDAAAAIPYAQDLVRLWTELREALAAPANFNFCDWWSGVVGLATEVGAKKISSEEETYSDNSVLIFYNNFVGIRHAVAPFLRTLGGSAGNGSAIAAAAQAALAAADASVAPFVSKGARLPTSLVPTTGLVLFSHRAARLLAARCTAVAARERSCRLGHLARIALALHS